MITSRRRLLELAAAALAAPAFARRSFAADWPQDKPIRAIIPFNAGSSIDIIARIVAEPLSRQIGQSIVLENRGGGGGVIGTLAVAKAAPDGYALLVNAANHSIAPAVYKDLAFDAANDFAGIALLGTVPNVLVVGPSKGIKTAQELIARAKSQDVTFSSSGIGSASHWAAERFRISAGFNALHVPLRGGLESLMEVMNGEVDFCCTGISPAMPFIRGGKLLPLVVTARKRTPALPDVMTSIEAGYQDSDYNFWNGLLAPAKTPRAIVDRLHDGVAAVLAMPDVQQRLAAEGVDQLPATPEEFDAQIRSEIAVNLKIAKAAGLGDN